MATKIIKAWIDGAVREIEVEDIVSPEQPLSVEDRLIELEDKPIITDGNLLVGNGTTDLEEMTPEEVLSHINGASVMTMTTEEYEALTPEETNANTLYMLTDEVDVLNVEVVISEDGLSISLVDTTPIKVIDAVDNGVNVCLYANISADEVRYYSMNGRGTNSFGEYVDFVYSGSTEVDTITISRNGRNSTIGRLAIPYDSPDVMITPSTAEVGQTIIVKAVDDAGKPTEWEVANLANHLLFDRETCMLYLMSNGQVMGNGVYVETVEGGGNLAVLTLENTTNWSSKTMSLGSDCIISFNWSSVEGDVSTGSGTVFVKVGGELRHSVMVTQGECSLNISHCLSLGYNLVHVSVFDTYGNSQMISFGLNVYDPDALQSTKLVERTLSGEYTNDRVTTIGQYAFGGCQELTGVNLSAAVSSSCYILTECRNLNTVNIPLLTTISNNMFQNVSAALINLPSATELGYQSFRKCSIQYLYLPLVMEVPYQAFYGGTIQTLDFGSVTNFGHQAFHSGIIIVNLIIRTNSVCSCWSVPKHQAIYVPAALVDSYKAATNWSAYADNIFAIEDYPEICGGVENV